MMPCWASISAWALEPRMSWGAMALSKPIEAFISIISSAGDSSKRPPHILLARFSVKGGASVARVKKQIANGASRTAGSTRMACLATIVAAGLAGFGAVYVMAGGADNGAPRRERLAQAASTATE